jgi:hypothetical protein
VGVHGRIAAAAALCSACLASPAPSQQPVDPDAPDGGDIAAPCGSIGALSDDFTGSLSTWRWTVEGTVGDSGAGLHLQPAAAGAVILSSNARFSLDGGELVAELDTAAMQADSVLRLVLTGEDGEVALRLQAGTLHADVEQEDFDGTRDSVAYQMDEMRWWRIARADGQFAWATRGDSGDEWVEQGRFDAALTGLAGVSIELTASEQYASEVTIAAINPGGATAAACPVTDLEDEFKSLSPRWYILGDQICDVQFGDAADIGIVDTDTCGLVSSERFSLADSEVAVELLDPADCSLRPIFQVTFERGQVAFTCSLEAEVPKLHAYLDLDNTDSELAVAAWSAVENRFLRFRHSTSDGGIVYETSPDGIEWTGFTVATGLAADDLQSVEVALLVYAQAVTAQRISFDQLNILPDAE